VTRAAAFDRSTASGDPGYRPARGQQKAARWNELELARALWSKVSISGSLALASPVGRLSDLISPRGWGVRRATQDHLLELVDRSVQSLLIAPFRAC
jgi:hypothetical protein